MKMPKTPPDVAYLWDKMRKDSDRMMDILGTKIPDLERGKYLHWDKLQFYTPPKELTMEEWWFLIKISRQSQFKQIPLKDKEGIPFNYLITYPIPERLYEIDLGAGGSIHMPDQITNPDLKDQYYISSLIQEAITSSQLEGAVTTRKIAKEMLQAGRKPKDRSEQMILNNFRTMQRIGKVKDEPLSRKLVFELHELVTQSTLDDDTAVGRFRKKDEKIVIGDMYNEIFHEPPEAGGLEERMEAMCEFANDRSSTEFIHPVIRSISLHFWLAYDHPFVDGNGRTARALFYWSMLRHGYWLFEFISISQIILKGPAKYGRAFLYTETDDNDLTYFILYHLKVIRQSIEELHKYIERKTKQLKMLEAQLHGIEALNHRQRALIGHALRHPYQRYTIRSHQISHNVVYQTARIDLLDLESRGLLNLKKIRKQLIFTPADDLEAKLSKDVNE